MKQVFLAFTLLFCCLWLQAKEKVVQRPPFRAKNTTTLEIDKIVMSDTATVFFMNAYFRPHNWIRVDEATYLKARDKKLLVKYTEGIELNKEFWMPDSGEASFKLIFPPLPQGTQTVDFIESDCETCFKLWGIQVDGKKIPSLSLGKEWTYYHPDYNASLPTPEIKKGNAILSGKLSYYEPSMQFSGTVYGTNLLTTSRTEKEFKVNDDGTFRIEIPMVTTGNVTIYSPFFNGNLILTPGKETSILFNLPELARSDSKLRKDEAPYGKKVYVKGAYGAINDEMINNPVKVTIEQEYNTLLDAINGMTPQQYKDYWLDCYKKALNELDAMSDISNNYKEIKKMGLAASLVSQLTDMDYMLENAYKKAHNIDRRSPAKGFKPGDIPVDYYDVLGKLDLNNPKMLLCREYTYIPELFLYTNLTNKREDKFGVFNYLINSGQLKDDEVSLVKEYMASMQEGKQFDKSAELKEIRNTYDSLFQEYGNKIKKERNTRQVLARLLGTDKGLLFDLLDIQPLTQHINDYEPLTKEQLAQAEKISSVYGSIINEMNNDLLRKIEENKKKTGYIVNETPQVSDEQLFDAIISKYKGKVIFVDFWATWCGPCRMAMKQAEPVKAALAGKDIVYLYLTGETSPLVTWKNMIPDIHGEHYRMTDAQWGYLSKKFNISGIPSYIIVDKNGKQAHFQTGFMGAPKMKEMLLKEVEKK